MFLFLSHVINLFIFTLNNVLCFARLACEKLIVQKKLLLFENAWNPSIYIWTIIVLGWYTFMILL